MREFIGKWDCSGKSFAIVVSKFNETVTSSLLKGAQDALSKCGECHYDVVWVPGAFEIPLMAQTLAETRKYHAVICLGAVIRGATSHYDYVCGQAASGIQNVALSTGIPVAFGILTCDTVEQAMDRAGLKCGNKGQEAAMAAVEMVSVMQQVEMMGCGHGHPCNAKAQSAVANQ